MSGPGVGATVVGSDLNGAFSYSESPICFASSGRYTMVASNGFRRVGLQTTTIPTSGKDIASPNVLVGFFISNPDDGWYPNNGYGSCDLKVTQGWPHVQATFTCTYLLGVGSGSIFNITNGSVACP